MERSSGPMWIGIHSPISKSCSGLNSSSPSDVEASAEAGRTSRRVRANAASLASTGLTSIARREVQGQRDPELERVGERVEQHRRERELRVGGRERDDDD